MLNFSGTRPTRHKTPRIVSLRQSLRASVFAALSLIMLPLLAQPGHAQSPGEFAGGGTVYGFNNCEEYGWRGSPSVKARFRPAHLPGNDGLARLSFFFDSLAMNLTTRGGNFTNSFQEVDGWAIGWATNVYGNYRPGVTFPQVRITRSQPVNVTTDTQTLRLEGIIRHFDGLSRCVARFEVLLHKR